MCQYFFKNMSKILCQTFVSRTMSKTQQFLSKTVKNFVKNPIQDGCKRRQQGLPCQANKRNEPRGTTFSWTPNCGCALSSVDSGKSPECIPTARSRVMGSDILQKRPREWQSIPQPSSRQEDVVVTITTPMDKCVRSVSTSASIRIDRASCVHVVRTHAIYTRVRGGNSACWPQCDRALCSYTDRAPHVCILENR